MRFPWREDSAISRRKPRFMSCEPSRTRAKNGCLSTTRTRLKGRSLRTTWSSSLVTLSLFRSRRSDDSEQIPFHRFLALAAPDADGRLRAIWGIAIQRANDWKRADADAGTYG